jgi:hypothetical protein
MSNHFTNSSLVALLLLFATVTSAQTTSRFLFKRQSANNQVTHTLSGGYEVVVTKPKLVQTGVHERIVQLQGEEYKIRSNKKEKKVALHNPAGEILGTLWFKGSNKMDVTLPDGSVYDWQKVSARSWKYVYLGVEVLSCKFIKESGKKYLEYQVSNEVQAIMLASHVYGVDLIQSKANQPIYWGVALGLVVMRAAIGSSDPGPDI